MKELNVRLRHWGMFGLVLGLAVYGCGDDAADGGNGETGGAAGAATGGDAGASTGGTPSGGASGGTNLGGGGMGGEFTSSGGQGGASCTVDTEPASFMAACESRCGLHACVADCPDWQGETACLESCEDEIDEAFELSCDEQFFALLHCEAQQTSDAFQCYGGEHIGLSGDTCAEEDDAYYCCLFPGDCL